MRSVALYERSSRSGAGLLITGNAVVDRKQLVEPYNVVVDDRFDWSRLEQWAATARRNGAPVWLQLSHPLFRLDGATRAHEDAVRRFG